MMEVEYSTEDVEYIAGRKRRKPDPPTRLEAIRWAHFPVKIPPTEKKQHPTRICRICGANKKRSETRWLCKKCVIPLHIDRCFELYHTRRELRDPAVDS